MGIDLTAYRHVGESLVPRHVTLFEAEIFGVDELPMFVEGRIFPEGVVKRVRALSICNQRQECRTPQRRGWIIRRRESDRSAYFVHDLEHRHRFTGNFPRRRIVNSHVIGVLAGQVGSAKDQKALEGK